VIRYLTAGVKHALGMHRPGRRLPVLPDDVLLASYPWSGDTWMRLLVANLLYSDRAGDLGNLHRVIIDPEVSVKRDIDRVARPRIVKTHGSFDPRYRRVIYLVRDSRDVAVSQYNSLRESGDMITMEDFIEGFVTEGADRHFGSWGENVGSWLAGRARHSGFFLLRYEDLLADTERELRRVADFAGWATTPEKISRAVDRSSASKMRENKSKHGQHSQLIKSPPAGGWQRDLPAPQVARVEAVWGDIMACLGYELVTRDYRAALASNLIGLLASGTAG
jgi:Sulfotransferase domain